MNIMETRCMITWIASVDISFVLPCESDSHAVCWQPIVYFRLLRVYLSASSTSPLLLDHVVQRLSRRPESTARSFFPNHPSYGNTVIGGGWKKGCHAFGDDKRLKKLIILILFSSSYEEGSPASHVAGCAFDPLLTHDQAAKCRS